MKLKNFKKEVGSIRVKKGIFKLISVFKIIFEFYNNINKTEIINSNINNINRKALKEYNSNYNLFGLNILNCIKFDFNLLYYIIISYSTILYHIWFYIIWNTMMKNIKKKMNLIVWFLNNFGRDIEKIGYSNYIINII